MAQFCTHCGKPLSPGIRFCPACGSAVANPTTPSPNQPISSTPSQAPQFMPVTASVASDPIPPSVPAPSVSDKWADVAAPIAPETTSLHHRSRDAPPSSQFAPVDVTAAPPASTSTPNQGWADVAPVNVPASNGSDNSTTAGQQAAASFSAAPPPPASAQRWSQTPPPQTAPPASSASQQWSQTTPPASNAGQQWTQTPNTSFPAPAPVSGVGQPRQRSILPKLIGIALVLILLVGVVVVGGVVYVGYKVRQKTRGVTQDLSRLANEQGLDLTKGGSPDAKGALQSLLGALSGKKASADGLPVLSSSDPVTPCGASSFPVQDNAKVPFKPGTIFTTAWGVKYGDVEARNSVDSINDSTVTTTFCNPRVQR